MAAPLPRLLTARRVLASCGWAVMLGLAACSGGGDADNAGAQGPDQPADVVDPPATAAPTPTPLPTPTPTPAPVLSAAAVTGSGLVELRLDQDVPWTTTGVTVDGVLRAVHPTGDDATLAATVWVPATASEVCVGQVAATTRPVFWDAGTEPTPPPEPTLDTPLPDAAPATTPQPAASPAPTATPQPTPTPTPDPTPTPAPPEPRFCTSVTGTVDVPATLFPGHRVIAHYGTAITPVLGVLGEGSPQVALERLVEAAAGYDEFDLPVVPAFEFIVTVAQGSPGADGRYTLARPAEEVRPYLDGVRQVGGIVVLDLQPGQAAFLDQAQQYAELLMEPDVHLALDPEWSMDPGQVPGQVFGDTDGATVNQVATWLQELVIRHGLPQKTLIVHQFLAGMVDDRDLVQDPEGIAVMFHIDGQGPVGAKFGTYDQLSVQPPFFNGFKVFFDEDSRVMEPAEVMTVDPAPVYVSYQ